MNLKKFKRLTLFLLVSAAFSAEVLAAGVITKTVQAIGTGSTRPVAVQAALTEAVSQVSGISLKAQTASVSAAASAATIEEDSKGRSEESRSSVSDALASSTETKTKGHVKSFSVVDVTEEPNGLFKAVVDADISVYKDDSQSTRRRIAVIPFYYRGNTKLVEDFDQRLRQSLVDYLTGTRHFAVLDRDFQGDRLGELAGLLNPDVKPEERARIGNSLGSDYVLVGQINNFVLKQNNKQDPYTKEISKVIEGHVSLSWRLIEAATGQIAASGTEDKIVKLKKPEDVYEQGAEDGYAIGAKLSNIIYPIMALAYNNGTLTLSQGGDTVKVGDVYNLVKYGKVLEDPYTGEPLARDEIKVGQVRISDVSPKISHASVIKSNVDLVGLVPREYILRALPREEAQQTKKKVVKTQQPKW